MNFSVTILGTSSAVPNSQRNPSAQVINVHERFFLVDCGEGTQTLIRRYKLRLSKINHIFISHLHGDHVYGLFGLLSTYSLIGRTETLTIYANPKLKELIAYHNVFFDNKLTYPLVFVDIIEGEKQVIYDDDHLAVTAFPLKHSVPTHGFLFVEKPRLRRINKPMTDFYKVPGVEMLDIKKGSDFVDENGQLIPNSQLTFEPAPIRSFAYCSDTAYFPEIAVTINGVDLLYHEATFVSEDVERAYATLHSTAAHAATMANLSKAKNLIIGHFSTRYKELNPLLNEAKQIFESVELAQEGKTYFIEENLPN